MPAPRKRSAETDDAFFAALARGEPVGIACRAAGCSRQALYRRRIKDLVFDRRWREAEATAAENTRNARPRKRMGYTLPLFAPRRGKKPLSHGMLLARLKVIRPTYREPRDPPHRDRHPYTIIEERDELRARLKHLKV